MIKSILQRVLFVLALVLLQVSFFPVLTPFNKFNFVLVSLLFLGFIYNFKSSMIYGLVIGFILEIYSVLPFGAIVLALLLGLFVCEKIFTSLLTNRSFYTILILTFVATALYHTVIFGFMHLQIIPVLGNFEYVIFMKNSMIGALYALVMNVAFASLLYWFFSFFTKRFSAILTTD